MKPHVSRRSARLYAATLASLALVIAATTAMAGIMSVEDRPMPLTKGTLLPGTTWSSGFALGDGGLEPRPSDADDGRSWIESAPVSVGLAWRPPQHVSVTLYVQGTAPSPKPWPGEIYGMAYVRFGCDAVNWSTWHALATEDEARPSWPREPGKPAPLMAFDGTVGVPDVVWRKFDERRDAWLKTKPAWESDDDEYARWLLTKEPAFFAKHLPLVGWLQFRVELSTITPAVRLTGLLARAMWSVGGGHVRPRDGKPSPKEGKPWSLDLRPRAK